MRLPIVLIILLASGDLGAAAERSAVRTPIATAGLRDCDGGFILPGSETCLRLGGAVEADATVGSGLPKTGDRHGVTRLGTTARVALDARTPTAMGPLRVYLSVRNRMGADGFGP